MHDLDSPPYNSDDGSHDTCPTCGGRAHTTAQRDERGHTYRLACRTCSWGVPLDEPLSAATGGAVLVTDGGTTTTDSHETARDRLARLTSTHATRVRKAIDGDETTLEAADLRAVLAESNGRIAYVVQHKCGVEYIYRDGETIHTRTRHRENKVWPPETLETDSALARRTRKRFDVVARENIPAWVTATEGDR